MQGDETGYEVTIISHYRKMQCIIYLSSVED
jgi:hypothetical protein